MYRSPILNPEYLPQFSGHETFPMRYGWLKKAYESVIKQNSITPNESFFSDDSAVAELGVGKNMVTSMRHWAIHCDVIRSKGKGKGKGEEVGWLGKKLFGNNGLDPFMESPTTLWLLHWHLAGKAKLTTWYWVFNHHPSNIFDREHVFNSLKRLSNENGWSRTATATIKRDVECFFRTYAAKPLDGKNTHEDALESPLTELGIIKSTGKKDGFRMVKGEKNTLGNGVFTYALLEFWDSYTTANTLSFEAIAHHPGSPGKVFQLAENDIVERLSYISLLTEQRIDWSETAGLKQIVRNQAIPTEQRLSLIDKDYRKTSITEAA